MPKRSGLGIVQVVGNDAVVGGDVRLKPRERFGAQVGHEHLTRQKVRRGSQVGNEVHHARVETGKRDDHRPPRPDDVPKRAHLFQEGVHSHAAFADHGLIAEVSRRALEWNARIGRRGRRRVVRRESLQWGAEFADDIERKVAD